MTSNDLRFQGARSYIVLHQVFRVRPTKRSGLAVSGERKAWPRITVDLALYVCSKKCRATPWCGAPKAEAPTFTRVSPESLGCNQDAILRLNCFADRALTLSQMRGQVHWWWLCVTGVNRSGFDMVRLAEARQTLTWARGVYCNIIYWCYTLLYYTILQYNTIHIYIYIHIYTYIIIYYYTILYYNCYTILLYYNRPYCTGALRPSSMRRCGEVASRPDSSLRLMGTPAPSCVSVVLVVIIIIIIIIDCCMLIIIISIISIIIIYKIVRIIIIIINIDITRASLTPPRGLTAAPGMGMGLWPVHYIHIHIYIYIYICIHIYIYIYIHIQYIPRRRSPKAKHLWVW